MIFKGRHFKLCPNVLMLPNRDSHGKLESYVEPDKENYVYFGRCYKDKRSTDGMVKTEYYYDQKKEFPAYAEIISCRYHSLTNLMISNDGYMYLAKDGKCYRAKTAVQA